MSGRVYIVLLSVFIILTSCVENLDVDGAYERKVAVNCLLCAQEPVQTVDIKYNGKMGTIIFDRVLDAEVVLYADGVLAGKFKKVAFSRWQMEYTPIPGVTYRLEVSVPDEAPIIAETVMPYPALIEKEGAEDNPYLRRYVQSSGHSAAYWTFALHKQPGLEPDMEVPENFKQLYSRCHISTGHPYVDNFNRLGTMFDTYDAGIPGSYPDYDGFLRIPELTLDENLEFDFESHFDNTIVVIRTMSSDYDLYLKSSYQKLDSYIGGDITDFFEENVIYSNFTNGVGIFGAYTEQFFLHNEFHP